VENPNKKGIMPEPERSAFSHDRASEVMRPSVTDGKNLNPVWLVTLVVVVLGVLLLLITNSGSIKQTVHSTVESRKAEAKNVPRSIALLHSGDVVEEGQIELSNTNWVGVACNDSRLSVKLSIVDQDLLWYVRFDKGKPYPLYPATWSGPRKVFKYPFGFKLIEAMVAPDQDRSKATAVWTKYVTPTGNNLAPADQLRQAQKLNTLDGDSSKTSLEN